MARNGRTHSGEREGSRLFARTSVQLAGAFLVAVLAPAVFRFPDFSFVAGTGDYSSLHYAAYGSGIAILLGYWAFRQLAAYPGVEATVYIVPSLAIAYAVVIFAFFFLRIDYSRAQFLGSFLLSIVWFYAVYFLVRRAVKPVYALVEVGDTKELDEIGDAKWLKVTSPEQQLSGYDAIVVDLRADLGADWKRFLAESALKGYPVYHVKQMAEALTGKVEIEHLSENSLGSILPSLLYLKVKRLIDLVLAILVAPVFALIIAVAAIAIKFDSRGPVFFQQLRRGFRGEPFTMVKLRTMHDNALETGNHFTEEADLRITRVGRILRKYRIDELPQIINVLAGEMSWIGPRPEAMQLSEWYEKEVPFYAYRHIVHPGITGWAQVNQGNVAQVEAATYKLHYDFYYIKHFSPWLDALIVAKTIRTMLTGFGSK